ncbi:hypothetical protein IFM89_011598 [Coptis chinensis]|uniref:Uncharacterized protein n=1 Tax=Coptis chinensis TaxID=261450 RepID=A0A835LES5_9MAGN|nr:hypothetical protein IFM89_011598 [Coptis chinensis]
MSPKFPTKKPIKINSCGSSLGNPGSVARGPAEIDMQLLVKSRQPFHELRDHQRYQCRKEFDAIEDCTMECANDIKKYTTKVNSQRVYVFLAGLDSHLDGVRGCVLAIKPLPDIQSVYAMVCVELNPATPKDSSNNHSSQKCEEEADFIRLPSIAPSDKELELIVLVFQGYGLFGFLFGQGGGISMSRACPRVLTKLFLLHRRKTTMDSEGNKDECEEVFLDEQDIVKEIHIDEEELPEVDDESNSDVESDSDSDFEGICAVACSPTDSTLVAAGGSGTGAFLWNINQGDQRQVIIGHDDSVSSVAFSADGKFLACGTGQGRVQVWDICSSSHKCTFDGPEDIEVVNSLISHEDLIQCVGLSPRY